MALAQEPMGEKDAIDKSHIDFTRQFIYFVISNDVEYDGHIFNNGTSDNPFMFEARISGVKIYRKNNPGVLYQHRSCGEAGCKVIHLELKNENVFKLYDFNGLIPLTQPLLK